MMNSKKQKNKVLIFSIYSLSVAIIWSLFIGLIFYISRFFDSPLESGYDYLGFIGSIIGGLLTLIGVSITIKHEEKTRISENKPILFINPDISFDLDENNKILNLKIKISNSGKGIAYSIDVEPAEETIIRDKNSFIGYLPGGKEIESCFLFQYKDEFDLFNFSNLPHEFKISFDSFYKCNDLLYIYINPFADELNVEVKNMTEIEKQGEILRKIRKEKTNYTIEEVSKKLGHSKVWLSDIERGKKNIYFADAKKICSIYGVDISYLSNEIDRINKKTENVKNDE